MPRAASVAITVLAIAGFGCSEVTVVPAATDRPTEDQLCREPCDDEPTFACVTACGSAEMAEPTCVGGAWECPPVSGRFPSSLCDLPHPPGECGGVQAIPCTDGFVCDYGDRGDGTCGRSGQMGTCVERPPSCYGLTVPTVPYCGCGGGRGYLEGCPQTRPFPPATYATCDGVDDAPNRCGPWLECANHQYCVRRPAGPAGVFEYTCEDSPHDGTKTMPSCESLGDHECGAACGKVGDMVLLTCGCAD